MKKIYIVTDLGPGDGGKGGVVHKLSHMQKAHTIIKVGGAQGSHGVRTSSGDHFAFSQFGCGTFEGVRTHLSQRFIASPEGILNEADALRYSCGIHHAFDLLTVDEEVVCATPYHGIASRVQELARGKNPRGTIGTGVGEAFRFTERNPDLTIHVKDLLKKNLREKIVGVREQVEKDITPLLLREFSDDDQLLLRHELDRLSDPGFLEYVVRRFSETARRVKIVGREYMHDAILSRDGVVVVESSHGVLTDHYQGFHPHTSAIRTLPRFAKAMIEEVGYDGKVVSLGVTRAYQIRHGAGPMPTVDNTMAESLLPGSSKEENRYQGKVRVGPLDLVLLRYAIAASGGPKAFDGLAISWFDQVQRNGLWRLCDQYQGATDDTFFSPSGEIKVKFGEDTEQLIHQERLGQVLQTLEPKFSEYDISPSANREQLFEICAKVIKEKVDVDVRMVSFGPTERDKMCK